MDFFSSYRQQAQLLSELIRRDVAAQYKGAGLGALWSLLNPLLMLAVYTFVFSEIFGSRWSVGGVEAARLDFALNAFCGLTVFSLCSTVLTRAPQLVTAHPNYVKRVVFPLALLPLMALGSALVQTAIAFLLLTAAAGLTGVLGWSALWGPLIVAPLAFIVIGLAWAFTAVGVFVRDLQQVIGLAMQALMFLSPIFYPVGAVPAIARFWFTVNPLAWCMDALRGALLRDQAPDIGICMAWFFVGLIIAASGSWLFHRLRPAFADVV
ncbi:MAG TPA: ABC transporter permease [Accumulibacter sp.]|uniref:ABC transporter permease n=1 Tax=Accumulibacter sp. TaxID=2053492 RepID=UPI002CFED872|nr:ABC transporter permease [Accumulibacter sp.]HMW55703.1 ABC transporter permease [Accumulibacter sp.]